MTTLKEPPVKPAQQQRARVRLQWGLAVVAIAVLSLGWWLWPLGFVVPAAMIAGMAGGFFRGRWVCGNLCPRGSLLDRVAARLSPGRRVPRFLSDMRLRWALFAGLFGFMIFRLSRNPADIAHWGRTFWLMCTITTGIAFALAVFTRERAWCTFCPVGTFARSVSSARHALRIAGCRACGRCDKECPMGIPVSSYRDKGYIENGDCIHCGRCIAACPFGALSEDQS